MSSVNHHRSSHGGELPTSLLLTRVGPQLRAASQSKAETSQVQTWLSFLCGKRADETGVMVSEGIHLPTGSELSLNLLNHPRWEETGRSKATRFLISLLIPPDLVHPGPACCNPPVWYPPHVQYVNASYQMDESSWHTGLQPFQKGQMYQHSWKSLFARWQST